MMLDMEQFFEDVAAIEVPVTDSETLHDECMEGITREENRVKNVHILGFTSRNKRGGKKYQYSVSAVQEAAPLYEGTDVYVDHAKKQRSVVDKIGFLENVSFVENVGLKGDLVLNEKHSFYEQLVWWVDNRPSQVGLSHHGGGVFNRQKGMWESIGVVNSVDIVAKPATTNGMFAEGVIEDSLDIEKMKSRFHELIGRAIELVDEAQWMPEDIATRAAAVRRIADNLMSAMVNFDTSNPERNPDNTQEGEEMDWKDITFESLSEHRDDLISRIREEERVLVKAQAAKFAESMKDIPTHLRTEIFEEQCHAAIEEGDDEKLQKILEDRKTLATQLKTKPRSTGLAKTFTESEGDDDEEFDIKAALGSLRKKGK